jgi:hypothetical protein
MYLAVCGGLSGRVQELFDLCAGWEAANEHSIACVIQLGDLPLVHDFSRIARANRSQGSGLQGPRSQPGGIADYVHGRQSLPYPLSFVLGEQDDPSLLGRFSLPPGATDSARPGESLQRTIQLALSVNRLYFVPTGESVCLAHGAETVTVAALSMTPLKSTIPSTAPPGRRPKRGAIGPPPSAASTRLQARRLLGLPAGSVSLLLSHESIDYPFVRRETPDGEQAEFVNGTAARAGDASRPDEKAFGSGAPGERSLLIKIVDHLQPRLAFYGHSADLSEQRRGQTRLYGLPHWPRAGEIGAAAIVDTENGAVELLRRGG